MCCFRPTCQQLLRSFHMALPQSLVQRCSPISIHLIQWRSMIAEECYHVQLAPQRCQMDGHSPTLQIMNTLGHT